MKYTSTNSKNRDGLWLSMWSESLDSGPIDKYELLSFRLKAENKKKYTSSCYRTLYALWYTWIDIMRTRQTKVYASLGFRLKVRKR